MLSYLLEQKPHTLNHCSWLQCGDHSTNVSYQSQKFSAPGSKTLYNCKGSYRSLTVAALF